MKRLEEEEAERALPQSGEARPTMTPSQERALSNSEAPGIWDATVRGEGERRACVPVAV